jgi:hypothetical protein
MEQSLRQFVRQRASERCEYCHLPQEGHEERFSVDHIVATKHSGADVAENLAFCCIRCNLHKGTDLTGIDSVSGEIVRLFDPRRQNWADHFRWNGPLLAGLTPTGRATLVLLKMNAPERVALRQALLQEGILPQG